MRTAMTTWNLHAPNMATKLEHLAAWNFEAVSLLHTVPPPDAATCGVGRLARLLQRHGMCCVVHGTIGDCDQAQALCRAEQQIHQVARFQQETGLVWAMNFDPGYCTTAANQRAFALDGSLRVLERALSLLAPLGVRVGMENWSLNQALADWQALTQRLQDEALGCLLDLGHLNIAWHSGALEGASLADFISALPLPIWEIHVHDNDGATDSHWPLGRGNLDVAQAGAALRSRAFDGFVTLEIIRMHIAHPRSPETLQDTLRQIMSALGASSPTDASQALQPGAD